MTLRVKYNDLFKHWDVEYLNTWAGSWNICTDYYNGKNYAAFRTEEEAVKFMEWKYRKAEKEAENIHFIPRTIPADYYGKLGRYYGD